MLRTAAVCFAVSTLPAAAAPLVVTDIAPVQALVAQVMAGVGDAPTVLVPPGANPHSLALKPSQARALQNADVVFWIGEELSPWLHDPLETLAENAEQVALLDAEETVKLEPREGLGDHDHGDHDDHDDHGDEHAEGEHDDHDEHDHDEHAEEKHDEHDHDEHGDEHADHDDHDDHGDEHAEAGHDDHDHHDHDGLDPHAWLSPENGAIWLGVIADVLAEKDPANADTYRANAAAGIAGIEAATAEIATMLAPLSDVPYGATHDAFQYFEVGFDLAPIAAITGIDDIAAGPARVAAVQEEMQEAGINCLFEEASEADPLSATVTEGTGAKVIALDQFGDGTSYVDMIKGLAMSYASCVE